MPLTSCKRFRVSVLRAALVSLVAMPSVFVAFGGCAFPITVASVSEESDGGPAATAPSARDADAAPRFADDAAPPATDADGGAVDAPSLHDPTDPDVDASDGSG